MIQLEDDSPTRRKKAAANKTDDSMTEELISPKAYHKLKVFERINLFQKIFGEVFVPLVLIEILL